MKAVFLDAATLAPETLDLSALEQCVDHLQCYDHTANDDALIIQRLTEADILLVNKVVISERVIKACPKLKLIQLAATGTDNIDKTAAASSAITVCNARNYCSDSLAQHVFALILNLNTRMLDYHQAVQQGAWQNQAKFCLLDYPIRELAGQTLGIIGYGNLGQRVAAIAHAFNMRVIVANRPNAAPQPDRLDIDELVAKADVISLHCPLTADTHHLFNAARLALMKPNAILINTARGGIVDSAALVDALRSGSIGGAGIDVLTREPPSADEPLLATAIPNLLLTPHNAWAGAQARQRVVMQMAENIMAWLAGQPQNTVVASI